MSTFWKLLTMTMALAIGGFAADVTGKWVGKVETPNGNRDVAYNLKNDGEKLTGSTNARDGSEIPLTNGSVKGDDISFLIVRTFNGEEFKIQYKGTVAGKVMKLKYEMMGQPRELTLTKE